LKITKEQIKNLIKEEMDEMARRKPPTQEEAMEAKIYDTLLNLAKEFPEEMVAKVCSEFAAARNEIPLYEAQSLRQQGDEGIVANELTNKMVDAADAVLRQRGVLLDKPRDIQLVREVVSSAAKVIASRASKIKIRR
jgi:hypothetical protein